MFCNMHVQFLMKDYNEEIIFYNESNTIGALLITSKQHTYAVKPFQLGQPYNKNSINGNTA